MKRGARQKPRPRFDVWGIAVNFLLILPDLLANAGEIGYNIHTAALRQWFVTRIFRRRKGRRPWTLSFKP